LLGAEAKLIFLVQLALMVFIFNIEFQRLDPRLPGTLQSDKEMI